ncbi:arrestin domain-containing protein 3-like isoform X2 [Cheilinus undulatus]|uniref:arrestin domain-containing protein 3-like isoform X2 n=1 Tax=Cheilinus undulatus TaxID=241271 RepID=UPI001BD3789C|nr:arrestin domain-containing protein 3-like isoform X2 [Cheilinus undulatus]
MVLGKVRALAVYFDSLNENNLPVFSGGDLVSGRVVVDVTGDVRVKSLDITARGVAKVRWTESRNAGANTAYTQNYTEEVEYLHHYDTLIGEERDEDCPEEGLTVLHPGLHEFAFSFNLPQMLLRQGRRRKLCAAGSVLLVRSPSVPRSNERATHQSDGLILSPSLTGESIQIFAEVENCSSRVVVPKAALYQTQTFFAKGKGKQIQQLVSNLRGDPLPQGKSQSWEGKLLKIPPVSPSILDCPIIRVEYALVVYVDVPGGLNLSLSLPLVIGTIPLHACASRTSSISSNCSTLSWLGLQERPEAPPSYSDLAISESERRDCLQGCDRSDGEGEDPGSLLTYITEFRYLPPPLYSEVDPYPDPVEVCGPSDVRRPDTCPSR